MVNVKHTLDAIRDHGSMALRTLADEHEALQQRCRELEEQYREANAANLTFGKQSERIAELKAALKIAHEGFVKLDSGEIEPGHPGIYDAIEIIAQALESKTEKSRQHSPTPVSPHIE